MRAKILFPVIGWAIASALVAQAPEAKQLLQHNWRARNAAALVLASNPQTQASDVLQVMHTEWQGHVPHSALALGGGGGKSRSRGHL